MIQTRAASHFHLRPSRRYGVPRKEEILAAFLSGDLSQADPLSRFCLAIKALGEQANFPFLLVIDDGTEPHVTDSKFLGNRPLRPEHRHPGGIALTVSHYKMMAHAVKWQALAAVVVGDVGRVQQVLLGQAPEFIGLSYGRGLEEEADLEGCRLMVAADIDPQGLTDFFQTLSKEETSGVKMPEFLSSHPETEHRVAAINAFVQSEVEPQRKFQPIDVDWSALQAAVKKL